MVGAWARGAAIMMVVTTHTTVSKVMIQFTICPASSNQMQLEWQNRNRKKLSGAVPAYFVHVLSGVERTGPTGGGPARVT
jgi:hypothetical protein